METRLTELEIRLTHQESEIEELNKIIFDQQKQIGELTRHLELLNEYVKSIGKQMSQVMPASEEAPPPHY